VRVILLIEDPTLTVISELSFLRVVTTHRWFIRIVCVYVRTSIVYSSDWCQLGGSLWVLRFPPPIKLTATIWLKYCWMWRYGVFYSSLAVFRSWEEKDSHAYCRQYTNHQYALLLENIYNPLSLCQHVYTYTMIY
jgi:hypothetical protein